MRESAGGDEEVGIEPSAAAAAALGELRTGLAGAATVALLQRLGRQCVRSARTSFPPPEGYDRWSDDAVDHLLADMFAREDNDRPGEGHKFLLNCYLRANDDGPTFERLLLTTIHNFLKDQAKGTERGKLRRRLTTMLRNDDRFQACDGARWALVGHPVAPWQGDVAQLERAAWAVRSVSISRWNESGPTPVDSKTALLVITEAVLLAAAGSVRAEDLAAVLQHRFRLLRPPRFVALVEDERGVSADFGPASADQSPDFSARVDELWAELTPRERRVVPHLGEPALWPQVLDVGTATAAVLVEALIEKLRLATIDDVDREDLVLRLVELCAERDVDG